MSGLIPLDKINRVEKNIDHRNENKQTIPQTDRQKDRQNRMKAVTGKA